MDPILALIADLYSQIIALQKENAQLRQEAADAHGQTA